MDDEIMDEVAGRVGAFLGDRFDHAFGLWHHGGRSWDEACAEAYASRADIKMLVLDQVKQCSSARG